MAATLGLDNFRSDFDNIFSKKFDMSISELQSTIDQQYPFNIQSTMSKPDDKSLNSFRYVKYNKDIKEKVVTDHSYGRYSSTKLNEAFAKKNYIPGACMDPHNGEPKESNVRITCFKLGSFFGAKN